MNITEFEYNDVLYLRYGYRLWARADKPGEFIHGIAEKTQLERAFSDCQRQRAKAPRPPVADLDQRYRTPILRTPKHRKPRESRGNGRVE